MKQSFIKLFLVFLLACPILADGQDIPPVAPNLEIIPVGSFIIPLDRAHQGVLLIDPDYLVPFTGLNLSSYGLAWTLLDNGIPVKWVIKSGKFKDEADFTANVSQVYPEIDDPENGIFRTSAFIIDYSDLFNESCAAATTDNLNLLHDVISDYGRNVAVYELNEATQMDVRYKLTHPPKVSALNDGGLSLVHTRLLSEAGIPHDTLTSIEFFEDFSCFTFISQPHLDNITNPNYISNLNDFLEGGGNFLAQCISAFVFENDGGFQSTNGFISDGAFDNFGYQYFNHDMPINQFEGLLPREIEGSLNNYVLNGGQWHPYAYTCIMNQSDEFVITAADVNGVSAGGNVYYIAGHEAIMNDFSNYLKSIGFMPGPIDFQRVQQLKRMYLNALFVPGGINFPCAGADICICPGESVELGCPDLNESPEIQYQWSPAEGLSCTDCPHPIATPVTTTTYTMQIISGPGAGCGDPSEITITVNEGPRAENVIVDCDDLGFSYTISFEILGGDASQYTVEGTSGSLTGNVFVSDPIDSNEPYSFEISDANECVFFLEGVENCCLAMAEISGGGAVCQVDNQQAQIIIELEGEPNWELIYAINGVVQPPQIISQNPWVFETDAPGEYSLISIHDANCEGTVSGMVMVEIVEPINSELTDLARICPGEILVLDATSPGATYLWQDGSEEPEFTVTEVGTYAVTITNDCETSIGAVEITEEVQLPVADLGPDQWACRDSVLVLNVNQEASQFLWQDGSTESSIVASESGLYAVTVSNACGVVSDEVMINYFSCLECDVYVPNAFTPNFDGINDYFKPFEHDCFFLEYQFRVFDRW
ncbi:MAG: hypothetical protein AAF502_16935, partial [Bacteroidota bacterium]